MYQAQATDSSGNIYKCHINALPEKNKGKTLTGPSNLGRDRIWMEIQVECFKQVWSGLTCRLVFQVHYRSRRFRKLSGKLD